MAVEFVEKMFLTDLVSVIRHIRAEYVSVLCGVLLKQVGAQAALRKLAGLARFASERNGIVSVHVFFTVASDIPPPPPA